MPVSKNAKTIKSPVTGRPIAIGGASFKSLLNEYDLIDDKFVKKVANKPVESDIKTPQMFTKQPKTKMNVINEMIKNNKIQGVVKGPQGREFDRNSKEYEDLIKLGYVEKDGDLVEDRDVVRIPRVDYTNYRPPPGLMNAVKNGGTHIVVAGHTIPVNGDGDKLRKLWAQVILYNGIDFDYVDVYHQSEPDEFTYGPSFNGAQNCVIQKLYEHFTNNNYFERYPKRNFNKVFDTLFNQFRNGVFQNDFEYISKRLSIKITIIMPNGHRLVYGANRKMGHSVQLYYNNNHVDSVKGSLKDKPHIFVPDPYKYIFDNKIDFNDIVDIAKHNSVCYSVETKSHIIRLEEDGICPKSTISLVDTDYYSATSYWLAEFKKVNPQVYPIKSTHENIDAICSIMQHGIMYSVKQDEWIRTSTIDLKRAYTNFRCYDEYNGFPSDLSSCVCTDNMDESEILKILNDHQGFGYVNTLSVYTDERVDRWCSFDYIRFHMSIGIDIKISYLMIGMQKVGIDTSKFDDMNKRMWHRVLGKMSKTKKSDTFCTTDPILAKNYPASTLAIVDLNIDNPLYQCSVDYGNKPSSKTFMPHIQSTITQLVEIQIEKLVLQLKVKKIPISRVWVDGVNIPHEYVKNVDIDEDLWHVKIYDPKNGEDDNYNSKIDYVKPVLPKKFSYKFNNILHERDNKLSDNYCVQGYAGSGKSTNLRELYEQFNNAIILLPKHNLKAQYPNMKTETIHMYTEKQYRSAHVVLLDEYTMVTQSFIDKLRNSCNNPRIVMFGDPGQLSCIINKDKDGKDTDSEIDLRPFNMKMLKTIHRQKDKNFQEYLERVRNGEDANLSYIKQAITVEEATRRNFTILSSTHSDIYDINMIGYHQNQNEPIHNVKIDLPIRFYVTVQNSFNCGDEGIITYVDYTTKMMDIKMKDGKMIKIPIDVLDERGDRTKARLGFSQTYHSSQGQTIDNNIALNVRRLFDVKMRYVGLSRATRLENVYILEDWEKEKNAKNST